MNNGTAPLDQLIAQAKAAGAEGVLLLRGLSQATLAHTFAGEPDTPLAMQLTPPGVLLLAFLPNAGGAPGVESR